MRKAISLLAGLFLAGFALIVISQGAFATTAPAAPTVTDAAAIGVTSSGATLPGTVNPNGEQTQDAFQWGPTSGYGHETTLTSARAGTTSEAVQAALSGLPSGTTTHFRIIAINATGTSVGSDQVFTTAGTPPAPSTPPAATTGQATGVAQSSATVSGTVDPQGQATVAYFEYGPTSNYGYETAPVSEGSGTANVAASANLASLASSTTYHFRLVAVSAGGTTLGHDATFTTTTPPAVAAVAASRVRDSSVILNGTVNPEGQATSYYFQFGTTTGYGLQSSPADVGAGTLPVAVHAYTAGLVADTTYHYRLVAQSPGGISYGSDQTVRTSGPSETPSRIAKLLKTGFVSPGGWVGIVIGCFNGQTSCAGHLALRHNGRVIAQRNFNVKAENGGPQIVRLSFPARLMMRRTYPKVLAVNLSIVGTNGQSMSQVFHLARWR